MPKIALVLLGAGSTLALISTVPKAPKPILPKAGGAAFPGTTALSSPEGFEECYQTLRDLRASTGRPLIHYHQLHAHNAEVAERLSERVNFNVPETVPQAVSTFFGHPTAQFISAALSIAVAARLSMGVPISPADAFAVVSTAAFWCVQEWAIHDKLLHSEHSWFGETVHRWHHELPYYHVSLDGIGLASVWFATVAVLLVGVGLLTSSLAPCLTSLATYTLCGGLYEAAHYLAHTRVPLPPALRKIRKHHTHHHTLSDEYWLAFTVPAIDSLFGTNPAHKDVSASLRIRREAEAEAEAAAAAPGGAPLRREAAQRRASSAKMTADDDAAAARTLQEQLPGLIRMARPNTIPLGGGLVALGAYGARHTLSGASGLVGRLVLGTLLTIIVTTGSMLINDYHDHKLGVDNERTKPGRPLVTGEVAPETVKFVLKWGYATHLTLLCLVETAPMRLWVLANTLLTYLYSVHLKPLTGVKNFVCAAIVSMAIGLGAIAVGGGTASLTAVWRPMAAVAGLIWHREMVMDIKDMEGDGMAGVQTVAVAYGANRALWLSLLPLACGTAAAATATSPRSAAIACAALMTQGALALWAKAKGFTKSALAVAIEFAPLWLLTSLLALTV